MKCSTTGRPQIGSYRDLDSKEKGQYPSGFITERRPTCIRCLLSIPLERCWHRSSSRFIDHIWSWYCHRGEMDPRAVPLPRPRVKEVRDKVSQALLLRHQDVLQQPPFGPFHKWELQETLCSLRAHPTPATSGHFLPPQELLPDPFKETPQHDTVLTKMSTATYLKEVLWDVCSSALGNIIYSYIHIFAASIILALSCDENTVQ